jgi:bifunctional non-homologous end joining protein LigD
MLPPNWPDWIPVSAQPAKSRAGALVRYPLVNDKLSMLWMVEFGCIDLHVWTSRVDRPDRPDVVLFDLDPADAPFADVAKAAVLLRDLLEVLGLDSYPMTTGGDGLHVRVPIARRREYDEVREFARIVAEALRYAAGGLVTLEHAVDRRRGVFVDIKMNGHGQQVVAAYSLRPLPQAAVATPLRWREVDERLEPSAFQINNVLDRVERYGDLAAPVLKGPQDLRPVFARLG